MRRERALKVVLSTALLLAGLRGPQALITES
jgi:hypothetical protein